LHWQHEVSSASFSQEFTMKPADNAANIPNQNKGTSGTNRQYDQNQGNRGKQLNPNQQQSQGGGKAKQQGGR
jgi:hypothetical protein